MPSLNAQKEDLAQASSYFRHAAASYGHLDLLEYLISKGGDINISDEDGDTPIFTVESVDVARWMVEHGAKVDVQNNEGQSVSTCAALKGT